MLRTHSPPTPAAGSRPAFRGPRTPGRCWPPWPPARSTSTFGAGKGLRRATRFATPSTVGGSAVTDAVRQLRGGRAAARRQDPHRRRGLPDLSHSESTSSYDHRAVRRRRHARRHLRHGRAWPPSVFASRGSVTPRTCCSRARRQDRPGAQRPRGASTTASSPPSPSLRFDADGTIDTTFGTGGVASYARQLGDGAAPARPASPRRRSRPTGRSSWRPRAPTATRRCNAYVVVRLTPAGSSTPPSAPAARRPVGDPQRPAPVQGHRRRRAGDRVRRPDRRGGQHRARRSSRKNSVTTIHSVGDLVRLDADGTVDTTFGGSGHRPVDLPRQPHGAPSPSAAWPQQPDGQVVLETSLATLRASPWRPARPRRLVRHLVRPGRASSPCRWGWMARSRSRPTARSSSPATAMLPSSPRPTRSTGRSRRSSPRSGTTPTGRSTRPTATPRSPAWPASASDRPYLAATRSPRWRSRPDGQIVEAGRPRTSSTADGTRGPRWSPCARAGCRPRPSGANVTPPPAAPPASFDGTNKTDLAVYLPNSGAFAFRPQDEAARGRRRRPLRRPRPRQRHPRRRRLPERRPGPVRRLPARATPGSTPSAPASAPTSSSSSASRRRPDDPRAGRLRGDRPRRRRHLHALHRRLRDPPLRRHRRQDPLPGHPRAGPVDPGAGGLPGHRPGRPGGVSGPTSGPSRSPTPRARPRARSSRSARRGWG